MAVIGQQNDVNLEKRSNSRSFLRKKSGQHSAIDEEAVVDFCLAPYVLQLAGRGRLLEHSKKNDVTACGLLRGMCHTD